MLVIRVRNKLWKLEARNAKVDVIVNLVCQNLTTFRIKLNPNSWACQRGIFFIVSQFCFLKEF